MPMFQIRLKRLSSQITLTLVATFSLLSVAGLGATWWSNSSAADSNNQERASSWASGLGDRINALQHTLTLTVPIYMAPQGEFTAAAKAALAGTIFDNPKLLPPFNGWNKMLDGHLSRITVCDRTFKSVAWVGNGNVSSAYPRGGECAAGETGAAVRAYLSKDAAGKPLTDVVEADGKLMARQYAFIQGMNPDTFENEVIMVLVIDQDLTPVLKDLAKSYGLAEIAPAKGDGQTSLVRREDRLIFNVPLKSLTGKSASNVQMQYDMTAQSRAQIQSLIWQALLTCAILAAAAAFIVVFMHLRVFRPMARLGSLARGLDQVEDSTQIPYQNRGDEIGELAAGLRMAVAARQNERESQRAIDLAKQSTDDERRRNAQASQAAAEAQGSVVKALASGLDALAHANLTYRLETPFPAEYEELRSNFNRAMNELQGAIAAVAMSAGTIQTRSSEISASSDELSRRTEQQAASLEETAAAMSEISRTVSRTASGTQKASEIVLATRSEAEKSGEVVRTAVAAMGGIEASAREISQIIGVIDEIAFQTNLLALNAGVEAARAGDAGKGFAVVASEVRALAQRSAEAAKQIKSLISTSTKQVENGVSLVASTGTALERIILQINEITGIVSEVARGAQEQAEGVAEVSRVVSEIDTLTQNSAAMAEESNAASHTLTEEASSLTKLVRRFEFEQAQKRNQGRSDLPGQRRMKAA